MSAYTVILPHKRNPGNNRALKVALDCLETNARYDHHLIIDAAEDKPLYERVNKMVEQATTKIVIYTASDMFPNKNWDDEMLKVYVDNAIVVPIIVEPGVIGIHSANIEHDFGRTPERFKRKEFENWCETAPIPNGYWFAPFLINRNRFLDLGGLQTNLQGDHQGFSPADVVLFEKHLANDGYIAKAHCYIYHLQRWSQIEEQNKENRRR